MGSGDSPNFNQATADGLLHSWKEIAAFFDVTIRTVQNWEEERGLPVQRLPGPRGRVWARIEELEAWRDQCRIAGGVLPEACGCARLTNEADSPDEIGASPLLATASPARRYLTAAILVMLIGGATLAGLLTKRSETRQISDYRLEGDTLTALDKRGNPLWNHTFDRRVQPIEVLRVMHTGISVAYPDLDGDGARELVFPASESPGTGTDELYCFDVSGAVRWRYTPKFEVRNAKGEFYSGKWSIRAVRPLPLPGGGMDLLVAVAHPAMFPSILTRLNRSGQPQQSYYHAGHINDLVTLDADGDGRHVVYAVGMANSYSAVDLIALDPDRMTGASREPAGDGEHTLVGLPPAREKARLLIPPTAFTLVDAKSNSSRPLAVEGDRIIVDVLEIGQPGRTGKVLQPCNYFQVFNARLEHLNYRIADSMELAYREYHKLGLLPSPDPVPDVEKATRSIRTLVAWN